MKNAIFIKRFTIIDGAVLSFGSHVWADYGWIYGTAAFVVLAVFAGIAEHKFGLPHDAQ